MRKLKFRVWDKETKSMSAPRSLEDLCIMKDTLADFAIMDEKLEFMQFTGLMDKNSKEIYEGDIMKSAGGRIREVYWENEISQYRFRSGADMFHADMMEVIGNIYLNKELLK